MEGRKLERLCLMIMTLMLGIELGQTQQSNDYYKTSCPSVEHIVKEVVSMKYKETIITAPATLRLFFHDCFVQGCDASVMIYSANGEAEKDAPENISLAGDGFDTVIKAKQAVEVVCPGVVSCADILALAARDSVVIKGGPSFGVEVGRRDGLRSKASDVTNSLPLATFDLDQLVTMFGKHNLTQTDMIALSGAHTIGVSHCLEFTNRINSFSPPNPIDPTMKPSYAQELKQICPPKVPNEVVVPQDSVTPDTFYNAYYQGLTEGKGLFTSDQDLFTNTASKPTVVRFANDPDAFNKAFVKGMIKLGRWGVKTGNQGEIRKDCAAFN